MRYELDETLCEGHVELESGRWHWVDVPLSGEGDGEEAVVRTLVFFGEDEGDIMRRHLPGDHEELDDERARELAHRPDEREFVAPGGRCMAREVPGCDADRRLIELRVPDHWSVTIWSPGNRFLGEIPTADLRLALMAEIADGFERANGAAEEAAEEDVAAEEAAEDAAADAAAEEDA